MINQISITNKQIEKAKNLSEELGKLKNSITDGGHNIYGFLGELIVAEYLNTEQKNTYDYDMKLPSGLTIDVKTKRCTSTPSPNYECSIAAYNTKQKCDVYVFTRILDNMKVGWILGYKTKEEYFKEANFLKQGQIDPSNNYTVKADCYNLKIKNLHSIENLK